MSRRVRHAGVRPARRFFGRAAPQICHFPPTTYRQRDNRNEMPPVAELEYRILFTYCEDMIHKKIPNLGIYPLIPHGRHDPGLLDGRVSHTRREIIRRKRSPPIDRPPLVRAEYCERTTTSLARQSGRGSRRRRQPLCAVSGGGIRKGAWATDNADLCAPDRAGGPSFTGRVISSLTRRVAHHVENFTASLPTREHARNVSFSAYKVQCSKLECNAHLLGVTTSARAILRDYLASVHAAGRYGRRGDGLWLLGMQGVRKGCGD
ncbi:hypothetical protein GA0004734_00034410 [Rhizobium sp. 9140]|nr:hypothetical protein GA0004734_00034410 [Rhizobium sp. 9140]